FEPPTSRVVALENYAQIVVQKINQQAPPGWPERKNQTRTVCETTSNRAPGDIEIVVGRTGTPFEDASYERRQRPCQTHAAFPVGCRAGQRGTIARFDQTPIGRRPERKDQRLDSTGAGTRRFDVR